MLEQSVGLRRLAGEVTSVETAWTLTICRMPLRAAPDEQVLVTIFPAAIVRTSNNIYLLQCLQLPSDKVTSRDGLQNCGNR